MVHRVESVKYLQFSGRFDRVFFVLKFVCSCLSELAPSYLRIRWMSFGLANSETSPSKVTVGRGLLCG